MQFKVVGDADFTAAASASLRLTVGLGSFTKAAATIISWNIDIAGVGTTTTSASQSDNSNCYAATNLPQTLTVSVLTYTVTLALPLKYTNVVDFDPGAISSIGLRIVYASSNSVIAAIVNNKILVVAKGTSCIAALAVGKDSYVDVSNVQIFIVHCSCAQK